MAKGDLSLYQPESCDAQDVAGVKSWAYRELERLSLVLELAIARRVEELNVAPAKPRAGDIALADGTNWNPGSGAGFYGYYGGAWVKLG